MQVFRFLVRYYGDAGEKAEAASVAYFGGRQALLVLRHNLPLCDPCSADACHALDSYWLCSTL